MYIHMYLHIFIYIYTVYISIYIYIFTYTASCATHLPFPGPPAKCFFVDYGLSGLWFVWLRRRTGACIHNAICDLAALFGYCVAWKF